jgi:hypothetical protein
MRRATTVVMARLLGRPRRELAGDPALPHDDHPVAHADDLGQLGGDHQDSGAGAGQLAHQLVDAGLRADVDAPGRLVEHIDLGGRGQPLDQHGLLLVAAGQIAALARQIPLAQADPPGQLGDRSGAGAGGAATERAHRKQAVVHRGQWKDQPLGLAIRGEQADPVADRGARRADPAHPPVDLHGARRERGHAEHRASQVGAAGSVQSGHADDLARAQLEVDVPDAAAGTAAHGQPNRPGFACPFRKVVRRELPADHELDQLAGRHGADLPGGDQLAVLEHAHPVGQLEHLGQPVGDVEHGEAAVDQLAHPGEQRGHLRGGQRGGRLVQHQDARPVGERLGDLHILLLSNG